MEADNSRVLMSDSLKGQIPDIEEQQQALIDRLIKVTATWKSGDDDKLKTIVGSLRTVMFGQDPEIEFRALLEDVLDIVSANNVVFTSIELKHVDRTVHLPANLKVTAARILDFESTLEDFPMCTFAIGFQR